MAGLRPVAEIMTINFAFLALDAIINHAAKVHYMFNGQFTVPLVIRTTTGGGKQLGATHSHTPEVIFAHFPGLYVGVPGTAYDAKGMLKAAIRDDNPVLFVEHSTMLQRRSPVPDDPDFVLPIGKSDVKREGDDVTIVTYRQGPGMVVGRGGRPGEGRHRSGNRRSALAASAGYGAGVRELQEDQPLRGGRRKPAASSTSGPKSPRSIQDEMFDYMDAPVKRVIARWMCRCPTRARSN